MSLRTTQRTLSSRNRTEKCNHSLPAPFAYSQLLFFFSFFMGLSCILLLYLLLLYNSIIPPFSSFYISFSRINIFVRGYNLIPNFCWRDETTVLLPSVVFFLPVLEDGCQLPPLLFLLKAKRPVEEGGSSCWSSTKGKKRASQELPSSSCLITDKQKSPLSSFYLGRKYHLV